MAKQKIKVVRETVNVRDLPAPPGMPSKVRIAGQLFKIVYRSPLIWPDGSELYGMVSGDDRTILIDPLHAPFRVRETLLHEIAHVYLRIANIADIEVSAKALEMICDCFGAAVCDLIDNNPWPTPES